MAGAGRSRNVFAAMRRAVCAGLIFVALAASAHAERRVALVIGQSHYVSVPTLDNPGNDARLIERILARQAFEIVGGGPMLDLDKPHFDAALQAFSEKAQGSDVALIYYAGHGVELDGENFLAPTDARPAKAADMYLQMIPANVVLKQLEGAGTKLNIILLDACRNNPFGNRSVRGTGGGLAQMQAPAGTLISYATQPGHVALDGDGDSPYSLALAEAIQRPGLGLFETFNEVGLAVKRATQGAQQPWLSSSPIEGGFYFAGPAPGVASTQFVKTDPPTASDGETRDPRTSGDRCDAAAGGPQDGQLPQGVKGVEFADLDAEKALDACRGATEAEPKTARYQFELGRAFAKSGDFDQAALWYRKGAASGSFAAIEALGFLAEIGKGAPHDISAALALYRKAADGGNPTAMRRIAMLYAKGLGVAQDDRQAYAWSLKSAKAGDPAAMNAVGRALQDGKGVASNAGEACAWFRKGAEAGNAAAMLHIGQCYAKGEGVGRNAATAADWYRRGAEAGNAEAMEKLADAYESGEGVDKSIAQAKLWRRKAKE